MIVALHDAEKEHFRRVKIFPNYALMKISAWHKKNGDTVEWWMPLNQYDRVYSSKVFDFTPDNPYLPEGTIYGGSGYNQLPVNNALPYGIDDMFPDYSIYPECDYAIGYLTRGCPNRCRWCIVPKKEGQIRPYRTWRQLVQPDSDKLVLMDNNILASNHGIDEPPLTEEDLREYLTYSSILPRHLHFESTDIAEGDKTVYRDNCDLAECEKYFRAEPTRSNDRRVVPGEVYKHFKGKTVKVIAVSQDTESPGAYSVVYECLDGENKGKIWHRPYDMFVSEVDHRKYPEVKQKYRFEKLREER